MAALASDLHGAPDGLAAATTTLTFHDFLERMKQPAAADLVRPIRSFMTAFMSKDPEPEADGESVQQFYRSMEAAFRTHALWTGASEAEMDSSIEALEKYIMAKLYSKAFAPTPEEVRRDRLLHARIAALKTFVKPSQLDVPPAMQDDASLLLAVKELQKLGTVKAPRDKLVCVLNCCRVINNLLLNSAITATSASLVAAPHSPSPSQAKPPGADDFLPVLIYVVLQANPPNLLSSLLFIQRYRRVDRLVSEPAYFFTNLLSAASFLENCTAQQLSIEGEGGEGEREFERRLQAGMEATRGREEEDGEGEDAAGFGGSEGGTRTGAAGGTDYTSAQLVSGSGRGSSEGRDNVSVFQAAEQPAAQVRESVVRVEQLVTSERVVRELVRADASGELGRAFKYLYATTGDLRVGDVEQLLAEYKDVVIRYFSLCQAVHGLDLATLQSMREQAGASEDTPGRDDGSEAEGQVPGPKDAAADDGTDAGADKSVEVEDRGQENKEELVSSNAT